MCKQEWGKAPTYPPKKREIICRCGCGNKLSFVESVYFKGQIVLGINKNSSMDMDGFLFGRKELKWLESKLKKVKSHDR